VQVETPVGPEKVGEKKGRSQSASVGDTDEVVDVVRPMKRRKVEGGDVEAELKEDKVKHLKKEVAAAEDRLEVDKGVLAILKKQLRRAEA
jgi:hypothetical protein